MSGSTDATAATPAWKKLGLKLKHSNANEAANGTPAVGHPDRAQQGSMQGKRKHAASAASDYSSPLSAKKPRRDFSKTSTGDATPQLTRKKSVAFADTPTNKTAAPGSTTARKTPAKPASKAAAATKGGKSPTPKKQTKSQPTADTKPALEYLRHWVSSRDSWKFNKNHQSTLIKAVFESGIPPADVGSFYDYIDDIKGAVRMRLRETALAIRLKDNTDRGAAGFPEGTADADGKQEIYEAALAGFLEAQQQAANKKRTFAEIEYVTTAQDADVIIRRLVKRMRAEMVIATLSDGDETDVSTTSSAHGATGRAAAAVAGGSVADIKTNGVTGKRRRKLRTNVDDSDSSSSDESSDDSDDDADADSDSDSGSDTSSSDSDDSSDEDDADDADENMDDDEDSSSSSSSSSDDDSDDDDSDDEADAISTKGEKISK